MTLAYQLGSSTSNRGLDVTSAARLEHVEHELLHVVLSIVQCRGADHAAVDQDAAR